MGWRGVSRDLAVVENLSFEVGGKKILDGVNFTIHEREALGLIGESGAGKSVLMLSLRGADGYAPTGGRILYHVAACTNRECLNPYPPSRTGICEKCGGALEEKTVDFWGPGDRAHSRAIKRRIAIMLQQSFALFGMETVAENILRALKVGGYPPEQQPQMLKDILDSVGLTHRVNHVAQNISGGEKVRVTLARQVASNPILLLLDEPTGSLDPLTINRVLRFLEKNRELKGFSTLISSHSQSFLEEMAPRSLFMERGKIIDEELTPLLTSRLTGLEGGEGLGANSFGLPVIECSGVKKYFYSVERGLVKVLDGVDISVREGEIRGVIGRSGAGKTTLVNIIAGIPNCPTGYSGCSDPDCLTCEKGYEGKCHIRIDGEMIDMREHGPDKRGRAKKYIGLGHEESGFATYKTIYDNLKEALDVPEAPEGMVFEGPSSTLLDVPLGMSKEEVMEQLVRAKILTLLGIIGFEGERLEEILAKKPDQLSVGERQRVLLALAMVKEPRIVILDEPSGTLDSSAVRGMVGAVKKFRETFNVTFLVVSHNIEFIRSISDTVTVLEEGKTIFTGPPNEAVHTFQQLKA